VYVSPGTNAGTVAESLECEVNFCKRSECGDTVAVSLSIPKTSERLYLMG